MWIRNIKTTIFVKSSPTHAFSVDTVGEGLKQLLTILGTISSFLFVFHDITTN